MPTREEFQELIDGCIIETTTYNGVSGVLFTNKINRTNINTLFLPFAGYELTGFHESGGGYWTSSHCNKDDRREYLQRDYVYCVNVSNDAKPYLSFEGRCVGLTVRPVKDY